MTGRTHEAIVFGTGMRLAAYRELLAEVARRAAHARRTGLTDELLTQQTSSLRAS